MLILQTRPRCANVTLVNGLYDDLLAPSYFARHKNDLMIKYVGERAKRASRSNTRRGNHAAFLNCTFCDMQASRSDTMRVKRSAVSRLLANSFRERRYHRAGGQLFTYGEDILLMNEGFEFPDKPVCSRSSEN